LRGIDAVELCRLDERVENRRDLRSAARLRAVVVFATYDGSTDGALGAVVVQRNERVVGEAREPLPVRDRVGCGLSDRERLEHSLAPEPRLELFEDGLRFGATE